MSAMEIMHEGIERPDSLNGDTYRIKPANMEKALYITLNKYILNEGTPHESVRPFEIFIASKDTSSQSWVVALSCCISAIFRKGGDFTFLIHQLKSIHDPSGGYFIPGSQGTYVPSVIAHIALVMEQHFYKIGAMKRAELSVEASALVEEKREEAKTSGALQHAQVCPKCSDKQLVIMDGCATCLGCGYSKCN